MLLYQKLTGPFYVQRHASAHHLYMTSRRFFIGPIPEGWINGHRKSWYRSRLRFKNYTSQTLSFSVDPVTSHYTQQELDHAETPARASDEEVAITLSNTNEESVTEDESAEDTQESTEEPRGELRTLSHPTEETEAIESPSEDESSSAEDSDATPRASAQVGIRNNDDIYGSIDASSSFVTAREDITSSVDTSRTSSTIQANRSTPTQRPKSQRSQHLTIAGPSTASPIAPSSSAVPSEADSTTHLLKPRPKNTKRMKSKASGVSRFTLDRQEPQNEYDSEPEDSRRDGAIQRKITKKMAKFNLDDNVMDKQQRLRSRIAKTQGTISANRPRRRQVQDGEIIKAERMLVSVEETVQDTLPEDYTENDSLKMETRTVDKWREFLVVCRKGSTDDTPFALQMYRTRVIPDAQSPHSKSKPYHEVRLNHKDTKVNLYSALDKTIVIWHPCRHGNKIYIVRPKSTVHAAEWYTFIRQILGWRRPSNLPINVPDLGVSLVFKHPFDQLEAQLGVKSNDNRHTTILSRAAALERLAAPAIIKSCIEMLEGRPEWSEVLKTWSKTEKMGLAWKRYDRLEWIFGANEENMYGSIAMQSTHELELRPRYHYPTATKSAGAKEVEPPPIEGFLIRLTSQKGLHQRMNKMFFKRLYFYSQDHFLLFCRPAKACPPTPPRLIPLEESSIPTARQIMDEMPMSWDIEPYPIQDGEITWLTNGNPEFVQRHDEEAYAQLQRNVHNIGQADGYIDLCKVRAVRNMQHGSTPADPNISEGPAVDFHPEPDDTRRDDGTTKEFEHDRTFELALENGLVIRLQAYNAATRDEWVKRLDALVKYWRTRCFDDAAELQAMRERNLKLLEIDEEMESIMGQFAQKWEVKKAETSPHLHNMCALSGCRPIKVC